MLFQDLLFPVGTRPGRVAFVPPVDVAVGEGDLVLTLDLPGLTAADLEIEVGDDALVVRGERRPELAAGTRWLHAERAFGRFERRVALPRGVDADAVTASLRDGVLALIVPKPDRLVPRRIDIDVQEGDQQELEPATA